MIEVKASLASWSLRRVDARARLALATLLALLIGLGALALLPAPARAAAPPREFMGISSGWSELSGPDFSRLGGAKVHVYRMKLLWKKVQGRRGAPYDFAHYDRLFGLAGKNGVRIIPMLHGSPTWVSSNSRHQPRGATANRAFRAFAAAAAKRYGPNGTRWRARPWSPSSPAPSSVRALYWQIWNEPNWSANWYPGPNPGAYAQMLIGVSRAMKQAAPGTKIMAGGLFWPASGIKAMSPESYIAGMFRVSGLKGAVDMFAFHPYGKLPVNVLSRLGSGRSALNRSGGSRKPIWVTEFGWATGTYDGRWTVREDQQAKYLEDIYRKFLEVRRSYRLLGATWFMYRDHRRQAGQPPYWGYNSGLLRFDRSEKPAWTTFSRLARGGF